MRILCRVGIHRYRELGVFGLAYVLDQCRWCGQGRVFHALINDGPFKIPAEEMAELTAQINEGDPV